MAIRFNTPQSGKSNILMPFTIQSGDVGVKQNFSNIFSITDLSEFTLITTDVSNYPNWKVYGSTDPSMATKTEIASGTFGAYGTKNVVNNPEKYPYLQIEVGPGSSAYMSSVKFSLATGTYQ